MASFKNYLLSHLGKQFKIILNFEQKYNIEKQY